MHCSASDNPITCDSTIQPLDLVTNNTPCDLLPVQVPVVTTHIGAVPALSNTFSTIVNQVEEMAVPAKPCLFHDEELPVQQDMLAHGPAQALLK